MPIDNEKIKKVLKQNMDLLEKKNQDYSSMNLLIEGQPGVVTRLTDKVARLRNLLSKAESGKGSINFESVADTFGDIANYGVIGQLLGEGGILNDIQRVLILNDEIGEVAGEREGRLGISGVKSVFPEIAVRECRVLEEELKNISTLSAMAVVRGLVGWKEKDALIRELISGWCDMVVVMHGLSIRTARLIEYTAQQGKKVILVGMEEDSGNTAKCTCCCDTKKAAGIILSGGLNG